MQARLVLRTLFCQRTTEPYHDEVFAIVSSQHSNGVRSTIVLPRGDGDADGGRAWDANDSGALRDRWLRYPLWTGSLNEGESASVSVILCESDNTNYETAGSVIGGLLASTGNPIGVIAGGLVSLASQLLPANADDVLGAFNVTFECRNGVVSWTHQVPEDSRNRPTYRMKPPENGFFVHLHRDGDYDTYYTVE